MEDNFELSYYQVMALMSGIQHIRESEPYFSDGIAKEFEEYVIHRTEEISRTSILFKPNPRARQFVVSKSMVAYLIRLTGVDIFDKKVLKEYTIGTKRFYQNLKNECLNGKLDNDAQHKL